MRKALFAALFLVLGFAATAQKFDKKYLKSPIFDRAYYLKTHLDVATAGVAPEKHWEGNGFKEGRASSPVFDAKYYLTNNKDLSDKWGQVAFDKAIEHYLAFGMKEGRQAHPNFDPKAYTELNADLYKKFGKNYPALIDHYLKFGFKENRKATK
jgi:hypothetical protein